jgi:tellurite resistance protein
LISIIVFAVISIIYSIKIIKYPKESELEFNHPIKINFYPLLAKILLILSIILISINTSASKYIWWTGVIIQSIFTIIIMTAWIQQTKFDINHMNPAWFIPVVGCLIIPIAGVKYFSAELSWFFFSIGVFWWIILTTIIINRIIFHHPIPDKLLPTLFILFAPPIIGFIALTKLLGGLNIFGNILYYFGLFLFILILAQYKMFTKIKFYLSWWAYSFPVAALTIGTILMYHESKLLFFKGLALAIFVLLNAIMIVLVIKTAIAIKNKKICIEEE